ncbi:MAG TPA: HD domain-containing protein [Micromonosporaceae bacterium]
MSRVDYWLSIYGPQLAGYYDECGPSHDLGHAVRVATMAEHIATEERASVDHTVLAALFHDVGHGAARTAGSDDHEIRSAKIAEGILTEEMPSQAVSDIVDAISGRRFSKRRLHRTPTGAVLDDADNLDALGLIGVSRVYLWIGEHGWTNAHPRSWDTSEIAGRNMHALRRHFEEKLGLLTESMHTATGRRIARARHRMMLNFMEDLASEYAGSSGVRRE